MIKAVLFDLDGTLLPMDQDLFVNEYLKRISTYMVKYNYNPQTLISAIWDGTGAMVGDDSERVNEDVFWDYVKGLLGEYVVDDKKYFDEFYENDFDNIKASCGYNPLAAQTVRKLKSDGLKVVLATNPIFPTKAIELRITWTGLIPEDFDIYTTYSNSSYTKPKTKYYLEILDKLNLKAEECLMVGNDTRDDMVVKSLGMNVFLLTDHLINRDNVDISQYPNGSFDELVKYIDSLR